MGTEMTDAKSLWSYNPLPGGCVLYLPLWSPGLRGTTFNSIDSYRHSCTVAGAVLRPDGRLFDGLNDKIALSAAAFDALTSCSLLMWYKPDIDLDGQATHRCLFAVRKDADNLMQLYYSQTANEIRFLGVVATVTKILLQDSGGSGESQAWHFVQVDFGVGGGEIWFDGISTATDEDTECIADIATATETNIGTFQASSQPWSGYIGEVFIYDRKIGATQGEYIRQKTRGRYT